MRTTLTIDNDLAQKLKELAHRKRASFKATVNDVLRRGLSGQSASAGESPFTVVPHHGGGFMPGIDAGKLNQLADQLDVEDFLTEAQRDE